METDMTAHFFQINDFCLDKCFYKIKETPSIKQEQCTEGCIRKVLSGMDFLREFDKMGGVNRKLTF